MINALFFDCDCISAFLWVGRENLLGMLYPGKVIIPKPVYEELSVVNHLKRRIDAMVLNGDAQIEFIFIGTEEYSIYYQLTTDTKRNLPIIGKGEAASIALAKCRGGVLASNNLKDISKYIEEYGLQYTTTSDIMVNALEKGFITESEGNQIWDLMLQKRRKLGAESFSDYIKIKYKSLSLEK